MGHDPLMGRQLLATLAILACGLVPDRLAGAGPSRLRASLTSGLFNRSDASRIERGYYEQLLDTGQRLDDLGDLPALRGRRRVGGTFGAPVNSAPLVIRVDDLREVALRPSDAVERSGVRWSTNAQGMRDREYAVRQTGRHVPHRDRGRLDRRRLGRQPRRSLRIDPRARVGRAFAARRRPRG